MMSGQNGATYSGFDITCSRVIIKYLTYLLAYVAATSDGWFATESVGRNDSLTRTNRPDSTFQFSLVRLYCLFSHTRLPLTVSEQW